MRKQIIELIKENKFKEAYEYAKNEYEKTHSPISLYYYTTIDMDFFHNLSYSQSYENLNKIKKKIPFILKRQFTYFYIIAAYETQHYQETYINCLKLIEANLEFPQIFAIASNCALILNYDKETIFKYADKAIQTADDNNYIIEMAIETKENYYLNNNLIDEARSLLNESYLKSTNQIFLLILELKIELNMLDNYNRIDEIIERLIENNKDDSIINIEKIYFDCANSSFELKRNEEALKYIDKALGCNESSLYCLFLKGKILMSMDDEKGLKLIESLTDKEEISESALYYLAKHYLYLYTKEGIYKAIEYYQALFNKTKDYDIYIDILEALLVIGDFEAINKIIKEFDNKNISNNPDCKKAYYCMKAKYEVYKNGDYDKGQNYLMKSNKAGYRISINEIVDIFRLSKKIEKDIVQVVFNQDSLIGYRNQAEILFHGKFNHEIDVNKSQELINKALELNNEYVCCKSLLGNILLSINEKEKAYKEIQEGYNMYLNNKTMCTCIVAFYAYCLYYGFGVDKDEDKAYNVLLDEINNKKVLFNENLVNLFAYFSYQRKANLEMSYEILLSTNNYRYEVGKYYMLIVLGKLLNKKINPFIKEYKKNLKFASILEKKYYNENNYSDKEVKCPFLTNN